MTTPKPKGHFRRFERRETDLGAMLDLAGTKRRVKLRDVGLGGAGVWSDLHPSLGAGLTLAVEAQSLWDPLRIRAEVMWASPTRFGVRFVDLGDDAAGAILDVVSPDDFE